MDFILNNLKTILWSIAAIVLLAVVIKKYAKIKKFILEVRQELTKVSWSTRQELMGSTAVVIVTTFIMAVFIGIIDLCLSKGLSYFLR